MQLPQCNDLLASLPAEDYQRLAPHLELVSLSAGQMVLQHDQRVTQVLFPTTAVVAISLNLADGNSVDTAMIGRDGVVGVVASMRQQALHAAQVRCGGFAYRLRADIMRAEFLRGQGLMRACMETTRFLLVQMGQISACNRYHAIDQRLARWVLTFQHYARSDSIAVTHQEMAQMLGVRREAITLVTGRFAQAGLMRFERGHLHVLDREGLLKTSCECYESLLKQAPFGKASHTPASQPGTVKARAQPQAPGGLAAYAMPISKALSVMATSA